MVDGGTRRRRTGSPYSRTGLFPWGNTYDVPAQIEDDRFASQTPCHLRTVTVGRDASSREPRQVRCPACGRGWMVECRPDATPPLARWTA